MNQRNRALGKAKNEPREVAVRNKEILKPCAYKTVRSRDESGDRRDPFVYLNVVYFIDGKGFQGCGKTLDLMSRLIS